MASLAPYSSGALRRNNSVEWSTIVWQDAAVLFIDSKKVKCLVHRCRRPEQRSRLLRSSTCQVAAHRSFGGARRAIRSSLLPVPVVQPEPILADDWHASR